MTETEPDFLSCDWGTTSFRLRRVSGSTLTVVREVHAAAGIKILCEEAGLGPTDPEAARADVMARFLESKLESLLAGEEPPEQALPLVISGMASSSIGWRELPYARLPFPLDGQSLRSEEVSWSKPNWIGPTFLISGMASGHDIMRGEETEIVGLTCDPGLAAFRQRCLLILPGTHSKHIWIEDQSVVDFRTFMTGELFEVLGRHSILRASLDLAELSSAGLGSEADRAAFQEGVCWGRDQGMAGGLFRVRTRAVLDRRPAATNTWFLSGLLIGAELRHIGRDGDTRPVILAATRRLFEPYKLALEIVASSSPEWIPLPPEQVEHATVAAHALYLQNTGAGRTS